MIERTSGITPEELVPLDYPIEIYDIWLWFCQMSRMRSSNGMSVCALSHEIVTWQTLSQMTLNPFELDVIWMLDAAFIEHHSKKE